MLRDDPPPTTFREVCRRVWLETLNLLAEYGTLVVFSAGATAMEAGRRSVELPNAANLAILVVESVTAVTMIVPKAIRAIGEVIQVAAFTGHDVAYALRTGRRRDVALPASAATSAITESRPNADAIAKR